MHKGILIVFIFTLVLFIPLVSAHLQRPVPFNLTIYKSMTLRWLPVLGPFDPPGYFESLSGGGFCRKYHVGDPDWFRLQFSLQGNIVKNVDGLGDSNGNWNPINFNFNHLLADKVTYITGNAEGICAPGIYWNDRDHPQEVYMSGRIQFIQPLHDSLPETTIPPTTETHQSIGTIRTLFKYFDRDSSLQNSGIINSENFLIASSTPDVIVWFGDSPRPPTALKTTKQLIDDKSTADANDLPIYACADLDHNGACDEDDARQCDTKSSLGNADYYKGTCCYLEQITQQGCKIQGDAFCGKTPQDEAQFATPPEVGIIHDFTACEKPTQVVVDDQHKFHYCDTTKPESVTRISGHDYYCNPLAQKFTECGGNVPISDPQFALTPGQTQSISGVTNYCTESGAFSPNLDYTTKNSCTLAGTPHFIWTGTRCCSEADDPHEYYNDQATAQNKGVSGGCWNTTFIHSGDYAKKIFNNTQLEKSVINYQGKFYGCSITNPDLLGLKDTDPHGGPTT